MSRRPGTVLIEAERLTKGFGEVTAIDGLDLAVESGRLLAILGRNGAGKSTLVNMLATLQRPDTGRLQVLGHDVSREPEVVRRLIGLAGQHATVEPLLTGRENLEIVATLFGLGRRDARTATDRMLKGLGLTEIADRRADTYSGGMRRRLDLGATLVGRPRLLLLDEPTTGLDPASRQQLWALIRRLLHDGTDVLLTTQYLQEAEALADRVVVLDHGRIVADGSPRELAEQHGNSVVTIRVRPPEGIDTLADAVKNTGHTPDGVDIQTGTATWTCDSPGALTASMFTIATDLQVTIEEATIRPPSLEEVFLDLTGTLEQVEAR